MSCKRENYITVYNSVQDLLDIINDSFVPVDDFDIISIVAQFEKQEEQNGFEFEKYVARDEKGCVCGAIGFFTGPYRFVFHDQYDKKYVAFEIISRAEMQAYRRDDGRFDIEQK